MTDFQADAVSPEAGAVPTARQQSLVRAAARALSRAGLVHAYGHCSLRLDADAFLVCAARPMGQIDPTEDGVVVPVNGELPDGVLGEVRIHQQIYQRRPDVQSVIRSMPRDVMTLSAAGLTPSPRHGMGSYFSPGVPLWQDPQLIRTEAQAAGVADTLGTGPAVVMQGNGTVIAAASIEEAVVLTWYLEDAARIELQLRAAGLADAPGLTPDQCAQRATRAGRIFERMWEYLCAGDPEFAEVL
ncbi:class II aldolase/adducin family protein [Pigmentiphaga litoralis]|uniref:HCOMODA/2-hydroxy-3-carboxy-muconic semialdehyde decarboxylase n=1 Tax=Pigmentiphaga litoralis TaxID=516702 RepID=A0A7Y9ITT5_9BURK|nr:class II aldolase/adducin family protein [Pigmentiphaga litoralis]NYE23490.1 HCOMODA/2-hydroxy-3-carboxy-muconic semialdehyde decarboxylase [Pigmentiphaga litoralis]NYE82896.1 HCOMODA/2-hydroxy-3-carboxy-muconic semialdehyde decarboxylase [Pigmentiphaga litoralis]